LLLSRACSPCSAKRVHCPCWWCERLAAFRT
jgi:hypothetical protein